MSLRSGSTVFAFYEKKEKERESDEKVISLLFHILGYELVVISNKL